MRLRRKRIFRGVALAFAVGVFAVPIAQARPLSEWNFAATPATASYTKQQLRALELRSQGMNARYVVGATRLTSQQLADDLRFQGVDKQNGLIGRTTSSGQSSSAPTVATSLASRGFDWRDAFVGTGAVFASAIVLAASFTAIKRRQQPLGV